MGDVIAALFIAAVTGLSVTLGLRLVRRARPAKADPPLAGERYEVGTESLADRRATRVLIRLLAADGRLVSATTVVDVPDNPPGDQDWTTAMLAAHAEADARRALLQHILDQAKATHP